MLETRTQRLGAREAVWLALLAFGVVRAAQHAWVSDDIFITFRYCDNVLGGLGPVYNAGERSEGYTHFLWFVLLTIGRALHVDAVFLGRWLGLPAFAATLVLLVELSHRLFPGRGGLRGIPIAAVVWAMHVDAQLFASGGLETAAFIFWLVLGFRFLAISEHARRHEIAAWCFGVATLMRPEGLLYSGIAAAWLASSAGWQPRRAMGFATVWALLVAPLFVFRMAYYGYPFPNPYYAKSGGLSNWPQGGMYLLTYFVPYFALLPAFFAWVPVAMAARRQGRAAWSGVAVPMAFAFVAAVANVVYVARVGGDFMFARFLLPASVFLVLLLEYMLQQAQRWQVRLAGTVLILAALAFGATRKAALFPEGEHVEGIVDEPSYYPRDRLQRTREQARIVAPCLEGSRAVVLVRGGQAGLAYFGRFPVAIEVYGLTDPTVAHSPTPVPRARPGHEKVADPNYLYERGVNLRFHASPPRNVPSWSMLTLPGPEGSEGPQFMDILVYDREVMEQLKRCQSIRFVDFPRWLAEAYIPRIQEEAPTRLRRDYIAFRHFYFDHNPDPEGLRARVEQGLASRGVDVPREIPPAASVFLDAPVGFDPNRQAWSVMDVVLARRR
jgi:hypothetical protein